jgi:hypothetical protein
MGLVRYEAVNGTVSSNSAMMLTEQKAELNDTTTILTSIAVILSLIKSTARYSSADDGTTWIYSE